MDGVKLQLRRVVIRLDTTTRDGDAEMAIYHRLAADYRRRHHCRPVPAQVDD